MTNWWPEPAEGRSILEAVGRLAENPGAVERQLARWSHQVEVASQQRRAAKAKREPGIYTEHWPGPIPQQGVPVVKYKPSYRWSWLNHAWLRRPFLVLVLPLAFLYVAARGAVEGIQELTAELRGAW